MFSERTGWLRTPTPLAQALEDRRAQGLAILDLAASNPTECGFSWPTRELLAPLSSPASASYRPQPFGLQHAREAIAAYYASHQAAVPPEHICLTTSTSEAYSFLFRLLCDPGDEVLVTTPSYPLFDYLADLDSIHLRPVPLLAHDGWALEPGALQRLVNPRTRVVLLVHPNNPTGHYCSPADRATLESFCAQHGLALIVDEVFLDYPLEARTAAPSFAHGPHPALTCVLSGLSKVAALPQMKVAWLAVRGPATLREEALARLELIADSFLSLSAPIQHALPAWLGARAPVQAALRQRTRANLAQLDARLAVHPLVTRLPAQAGWYAVLRVPATEPDDDLALRLLSAHGVHVHPGHYYGFTSEGWLVVSLLLEEDSFAQAVETLLAAVSER